MYQIHLYVPKTGRLTPAMVSWLHTHGQDPNQPERYWPVRRLNPKPLARLLLRLDPTLIPSLAEDGVIELRYPHPSLDIVLRVHDRGVIIQFPLVGSLLSRIVLGICYTYIRFLYDAAGFWSYDPQLRILSYADDFQSIEETARLMDELLPKLISE
ncbi:MAG: hypothetical protein DIU68_020230 [Chloroflexota bacterium]